MLNTKHSNIKSAFEKRVKKPNFALLLSFTPLSYKRNLAKLYGVTLCK